MSRLNLCPFFEICLGTLVGNTCIDAYEIMENTEFVTGRELITAGDTVNGVSWRIVV